MRMCSKRYVITYMYVCIIYPWTWEEKERASNVCRKWENFYMKNDYPFLGRIQANRWSCQAELTRLTLDGSPVYILVASPSRRPLPLARFEYSKKSYTYTHVHFIKQYYIVAVAAFSFFFFFAFSVKFPFFSISFRSIFSPPIANGADFHLDHVSILYSRLHRTPTRALYNTPAERWCNFPNAWLWILLILSEHVHQFAVYPISR